MKKSLILIGALFTAFSSIAVIAAPEQYAADPNFSEESTVRNVIPDTAITTAIKAKFAVDDQIKALQIEVETVNGKVTLRGRVPTEDAKNRAIEIAQNTKGVISVVADLVVYNK